ncbi:hypothetical protein JT359_04970 [Candidatus Poribacteria bacterium]|nr:hypothetical protein [Candidatus Poribacteria bacterium]
MLHLPPLRERMEDIPPLVDVFVREFSVELGKDVTSITPEALVRLKEGAWPGNIRQLKSTIQIAVALATTDTLEPKDFPNIYPEYLQTLISIWSTLPEGTQQAVWHALHPETQHIIMHELSAQPSQPWYSVRNHIEADQDEIINIENMNQNEILGKVANLRIRKHTSIREAAQSLEIDIRTLQRYAQLSNNDS